MACEMQSPQRVLVSFPPLPLPGASVNKPLARRASPRRAGSPCKGASSAAARGRCSLRVSEIVSARPFGPGGPEHALTNRHGREADAHDVERLPLDEVRSDDDQDQVIDDQPDLINVLLARLRGRAANCCWAVVVAAAVALRLGLLAAGSAAIQRPRSCRSAVRSGVCCSIATDRSSG